MDRPTSGGSYRRDPQTGALTRVVETQTPGVEDIAEVVAEPATVPTGDIATAEMKRKTK
jgi:hypothetical protein